MTDPAEANTLGQVVALLILVAFFVAWVAIAARRARVRDRQRMRRLAKLSEVRQRVAPTTEDRSER